MHHVFVDISKHVKAITLKNCHHSPAIMKARVSQCLQCLIYGGFRQVDKGALPPREMVEESGNKTVRNSLGESMKCVR